MANQVHSASAGRKSRKSFRKQVRKAFVRSHMEMIDYFRQCDAERERRYSAGDKGVYQEL